jgi:DNA mismatch endonuclease (patch repair protein)
MRDRSPAVTAVVADVFSKSKRSAVMARIRGRGNEATELAFVRLLRCYKITGWRRHVTIALTLGTGTSVRRRTPNVRPDFVFREAKLAIFVDGCFWHSCPIHGAAPTSNREFWSEKLLLNKRRDFKVNRQLRRRHWSVWRIWEHQLKDGARLMSRLQAKLLSCNRREM